MQNTKLNMLWLVVILSLLLTACGGSRQEPAENTAAETTVQTTAPEETIRSTTESTAAVEETTEATEETTEPTEETTAPTTGNAGDDDDDPEPTKPTEPKLEVPDPGTEKNPYVEALSDYPGQVETVNIPTKGSVSYLIWGSAGKVLTIAQPDVKLVWGEKTYTSDESGLLSVDLSEAASDPVLTISNQDAQARSLVISVTEPVGSKNNPQILANLTSVPVELKAGDEDGIWFRWTADATGTLTLTVREGQGDREAQLKRFRLGALDGLLNRQPEEKTGAAEIAGSLSTLMQMFSEETENLTEVKLGYEITASVGDTVAKLTESENAELVLEVSKEDSVLIHVVAAPDGEEKLPAVSAEISGSLEIKPGTAAEKPLEITDLSAPTTVTLEKEEPFYVSGAFHGRILTIYDAGDLKLALNDQTILPDESGTVTVCFPAAKEESPATIVLQLTSAVDKEYTLVFSYPLGTPENPDTMVPEENCAILEENAPDGYTFLWHADVDGELTITMPADSHWQYTLLDETHNSAEEPSARVQIVPVTAGTELVFTVNTYDPENPEVTPAGTVTFTASFFDPTLGTEGNPIWLELSDTLTIPAGKTVYYTARVDDMIMTLSGENVSVNHNGTDYTPVEGVITLDCKGASETEPPVFAITNTGTQEETFAVTFGYPLGHSENPEILTLGKTEVTLAEGNAEGRFFTWTAEASGSFTVTMTDGAHWQYALSNVTGGISGEHHTSGDDPVRLTETIAVSAGDTVRIMVNTYDPANPYAPPAGTVIFTTAFTE